MSETAEPPKPSVKSLADRFSREVPMSGVKMRKGNEASPTLPAKPPPGTIPPPKSMINPILGDVNKEPMHLSDIPEKSKSSDEIDQAANDDASPVSSSMTTKIRAIGGMAFPIPNQTVQLRSTHDASSRRSINFAPRSDVTGTQNAPSRPPPPNNFHTSHASTVDQYYKADHPYASKYPDELSFEKGAIIRLLAKECGEDGYWKGVLNGKTGLFPNNFISPYIPTAEELCKLEPARAPPPSYSTASSASAQSKPYKSTAASDYGPKSVSPVNSYSPSSAAEDRPAPLLTQPAKAAGPANKRPPSTAFLKQRRSNAESESLNLFGTAMPDDASDSPKAQNEQPKQASKDTKPKEPMKPPAQPVKHEPTPPPATSLVQATRSTTSVTSATSTSNNNDLRAEFDDYRRRSDERIRHLEEQVRVLSERLDKMDKF